MGWDDYPPEVWEAWRKTQSRAYPWMAWILVALIAGWLGKPTLATIDTRWPWLCVVALAVLLSVLYLIRYLYGMFRFMRMAKAKRYPFPRPPR